jgi:hypothetical protein
MEAKNRARDWTQLAIRRWQHGLLKKLADASKMPIYTVMGMALFDLAQKWGVSTDEYNEERSIINDIHAGSLQQ